MSAMIANGARPHHCGRKMARHGTITRLLANGSTIDVQRWRCATCGFTQRALPEGVGVRRTTEEERAAMRRLRKNTRMSIAAITREMAVAGVHVSRATVWRAVR